MVLIVFRCWIFYRQLVAAGKKGAKAAATNGDAEDDEDDEEDSDYEDLEAALEGMYFHHIFLFVRCMNHQESVITRMSVTI